MKENAVPSVFEFRDCVADESPRAKRYKSREDSAVNQPVQLESLDFQYETEVSSTDEITKLPIPENCQDTYDVEIQCDILVPVSQKYTIDNFRFDDTALNYYTSFEFDHYMMFFTVWGLLHMNYIMSVPCWISRINSL